MWHVIRNSIPRRVLIGVALLAQSGAAFALTTFTVTTPADSGSGSLRDALTQANSNADTNNIDFAIDKNTFGSGPWTIALTNELPEITAPVRIRGFSQPGSRPPAIGGGTLMLEIDDSAVAGGGNNHGGILTFVRGAERSTVTGLSFVGGDRTRAAVLVLANDVRVNSNYVGLRANGMAVGYAGVAIAAVCADRATIGGATAADGNVIVSSGNNAIMLTGSGHTVRQNFIGLDQVGAGSLGFTVAGNGVLAGAIPYLAPPRLSATYSVTVQQSFFGLRDSSIADNHIANTTREAINLLGTNNPTARNHIDRNVIARDLWGSSNAFADIGVRLSKGAADNSISDNIIGNVNAGILLGNALVSPATTAGTGNRLSRNVFTRLENTFTGIGLDAVNHFSPLANDTLDADQGPNGLQNKPALALASTAGGIVGQLDAAPSQTYTVEFFLGAVCHLSGFGAADMFIGSTSVTTDGSGHAAINTRASITPLGGLSANDFLSATATDATGNTSEFSACVPLQPAIATSLAVQSLPSPQPAMDRKFIQATLTAPGAPTPTGEVVFFAATVIGPRELGRVTLNGSANVALAPPLIGHFPYSGHYTVYAEYSGDSFHAPTRSSAQTVVVFRPPVALTDMTSSCPVRRDIASGMRECYDVRTGAWRALATNKDDTWIDADRFGGSQLDFALVRDIAGKYVRVDGVGTRTTLSSTAIGATIELLDLLHVDDDLNVDAIVRDRITGQYSLVTCAFLIDNCERSFPLLVNPEFRYVLSGDFNGDGRADLVWQNPISGDGEIWLMDGTKPLDRLPLRTPPGVTVVAAADVDADGYEDLVAIDPSAGEVQVTFMDAGRPRQQASAKLNSAADQVPGPANLALPTDSDFGYSNLLVADGTLGSLEAWRKPSISGSTLTIARQTLYLSPTYAPERTR